MLNNLYKILFALITCYTLVGQASLLRPLSPDTQQLLLIITADWNQHVSTLQRYQRANSAAAWTKVGAAIPVVLGKNGIAIGIESVTGNIAAEHRKKEGDKRTPSGIYAIGPAFGFNSKAPDFIKMPYLPLQGNTLCVDDHSEHYNTIINVTMPVTEMPSGEQMRKISLYQLGAVIQYNTHQPIIGAGSCIFMHIWRSADSGTSGCIAMSQPNLQQVMGWLDPAKKPVIVILTAEMWSKWQQRPVL